MRPIFGGAAPVLGPAHRKRSDTGPRAQQVRSRSQTTGTGSTVQFRADPRCAEARSSSGPSFPISQAVPLGKISVGMPSNHCTAYSHCAAARFAGNATFRARAVGCTSAPNDCPEKTDPSSRTSVHLRSVRFDTPLVPPSPPLDSRFPKVFAFCTEDIARAPFPGRGALNPLCCVRAPTAASGVTSAPALEPSTRAAAGRKASALCIMPAALRTPSHWHSAYRQ